MESFHCREVVERRPTWSERARQALQNPKFGFYQANNKQDTAIQNL